ncbi:1311_t:CDS:2 [Entrophospora sp. SA101]|nr:1311_t:CDS:2 [Entrophospora sp. SA101]
METLRRFAYKIIFCEIPSSIPSDISQSFENILSINPDEPNICPVCQIEISSQLTEPITILTCKHIFHHNCIDNHQLHCPICEKVNNEFSQTFIVANTLGDNLQINSAESSEKSQGSSVESASEEPAEEESSDESSNETDSKRSPRITRRQKKIQGLIMELSTPTRAIVEISSDGEQSLSNTETTNPTALDLARLFQKAIQTEKDATRDNLQINSAESSEKSQGSSVESASEEPAEEESSDESSNETDSKRSPRITRRQKKIQGLIMELSTPTRAIVEISSDGEQSLSNTETTNPTALDLARLFQKAIQTEKDATRGNQKEILSWYRFGELHENKVRYILANEHVTDKTARNHSV